MTERPPAEPEGASRPVGPWMPPGASTTPNAEKYLLEADALRRRQLVSALLHGSRRTWREQRRIWPAIVAGIVVVAVIVAVFGVLRAVKSADTGMPSVRTHGGISASGR
jgi:hypothetical protein